MKDFTLKKYETLLKTLEYNNYSFQTFEQFIESRVEGKVVILRHDVDRTPQNAIKIARLEKEMGIQASYYFRIVSESYSEPVIREIIKLNHELGYHYEDLSLSKGNKELALSKFMDNLEQFRAFYPVKTICMHGSPMSKWDNRLLWKDYNYRDYGIIAEPYFDLNFNQLFYITDAGRAWNNESVSMRDKVDSKYSFNIENTDSIINSLNNNILPDLLMISTHPHNWAESEIERLKILFWQGLKNIIKRAIISVYM